MAVELLTKRAKVVVMGLSGLAFLYFFFNACIYNKVIYNLRENKGSA